MAVSAPFGHGTTVGRRAAGGGGMAETSRPRIRLPRRETAKRLAALLGLVLVPLIGAYFAMIRMPGRSYRGPLPPPTEGQSALRDELKRDVGALAEEIGGRAADAAPAGLTAAADDLEAALTRAGYTVERQPFTVG